MSSFKRATVLGGRSQQDILAPLRNAQILSSKPVLPAEVISSILDYLSAGDLIRFARVSKRMKEMVYDDTRWVQRLQLMGCWNEAEARRRAEAAWRKRAGSQGLHSQKLTDSSGLGINGTKGTTNADKTDRTTLTLFDAVSEKQGSLSSREGTQSDVDSSLDDKLGAITLSPGAPLSTPRTYQRPDNMSRLTVFAQVRSARGFGRQEYGKIHGALYRFYEDAVDCRDPTSAIIFRTYRDPDHQARMLSNISKFSTCDTSQGWRDRMDKIADIIEAFETAVAREFEQGLESGDFDGKLRKYAHVLTSLNGGQKGVELFIASNPILVRKRDLGDPLDGLRVGAQAGIALGEPHSFFTNLSSAFNEQISVIDRVFPITVNAAIPFIQQIGKDVLVEYLSILFDESHRTHLESYMKAVSGTYQQALNFARSLRPANGSGDEFFEAVDGIIARSFEPHVDLYLNEEYAFFKRKSDAEVGSWERQLSEQDASMQSLYMSNVNRQADKRDFLSSFKKVVMMPVNVLPSFPISSPFGGKSTTAKALVNGDSLETSQPTGSQASTRPATPNIINRSATPVAEPPTTELAAKAAIMSSRLEGIRSLFSIEVALNLVHSAKSSIERAAVFFRSGSQFGEDARKQCQLIFVLLLQILGNRHIKAGFDQAVEHLANYKPREIHDHGHTGVAPLVTFLELVNVGDLIQQMLDVFYEQEMVASKLTDRSDFLDPAVKEKKRFEQMLDERVAAGLNKGIEVLISEVEFVCATTQKADDFNPGATGGIENGVIDVGPSETAKRIVEIVSAHTKMLVGSTDKNMLDVFNQEVGLRLFTALCKHLKRQRISVVGSIKLISDMNHYFSYIQTLKNQNLLQYFIALRELAQIYLVDPSDAKELATIIADGDRFHGIFRAEDVYEYAERRADWYQVKSRVERAMYGIGCVLM
ncbi:MAG: hypothetical protein Q9167_006086 [Letrouitia subvulpina]